MWTIANTSSITKKGKSKPPTPYFTITTGTATRTLTPDGSYNVYLITANATATIYNTANTTIQCLLIGSGGGSWTGSFSGGGGGGGFCEFACNLPGNIAARTITFTVGNNSNSTINFPNSVSATVGNGGKGGQGGAGSAGSLGGSGGGAGNFIGNSGNNYSGGVGSSTTISNSIFNPTSQTISGKSGGTSTTVAFGATYSSGGGGAGGAGGSSSNGQGGLGKSPTLPGIVQIYGTTNYCVGGNGSYKNGSAGVVQPGVGSNTYGSGAGGNASGAGRPGAIILAIHINDIPSPTP